MTTQHVHEAGELAEAQDKRRLALIERLGTIADLACSKPLEGELGDVAYDLLRQAAAQISSDRLRLRTPPTPAPDSEAVAEVISYRAVNLSAVVRVIPMLNGNIPLDVGTRLYAHPPTPAQPAGGWQQEQVEAAKNAVLDLPFANTPPIDWDGEQWERVLAALTQSSGEPS